METEITCQDLIDIIERNFATLRSTWVATEKESARILVKVAAEMLAERVEKY